MKSWPNPSCEFIKRKTGTVVYISLYTSDILFILIVEIEKDEIKIIVE